MSRRLWAFAALFWTGVILFSSSTAAARWCESAFRSVYGWFTGAAYHPTGPEYETLHFLAEKGFHVTLFLVFAILLWRALPGITMKFVVIIVFGLVVGSASELLQNVFPGRDPSTRDVAINVAGTTIGAMACIALSRIRRSSAQERVR